ncbi:hypothetical protein D3C87_339340 [compost metagenome]
MDFKTFESLRKLLFGEPRIESWRVLQDLVLHSQLDIDFSKARDRDSSEYLRLRILQRFIDAIFWIHAKFELSDIRRVFYSGVKINSPIESNLPLHLQKIDECHTTSEHFALYADLGSNIAIGDIIYLMANDSVFAPVELKGGVVNDEIGSAIELKRAGNEGPYQELLDDKKKSQQLRRFERQLKRLEHQTKLYWTHEAIGDAPKGFPEKGIFKIVAGIGAPNLYEGVLVSLLDDRPSKGWSAETIDDCLEIFVIRGEQGEVNFKQWAETHEFDGILVDLFDYNLEQTFSRPIVSFSFSNEVLWELLSGQVSVLFHFSINRYIHKFSDGRVDYKKVSGKRFRKLMQKLPGLTRFPGDCVISLKDDETGEFYWTDAMFYRMFGCFEYPSSIHKLLQLALDQHGVSVASEPDET